MDCHKNYAQSMPRRFVPGEHTNIDEVTPKPHQGGYRVTWAVRPLDGGDLIRGHSQGRTKGEAKQRAREAIADILTETAEGPWEPDSRMVDYIEQVSKPAVEEARVADRSKDQYRRGLRMLMGECQGHEHREDLSRKPTKRRPPHTIASATKFRVMENCLKEIARLHGHESARQARSTLSKYVLKQMVRDELIPANPLSGMDVDLGPKPERSRGGKALTAKQRQKVIDHLLDMDPAEGVKKKVQGRHPYEVRVAKRRHAIDLTLLQACTGVRISEANGIRLDRHLSEKDGLLVVTITADLAKNAVERSLPLLLDADGKVEERMRRRMELAPADDACLIGAPWDRSKVWEAGNCGRAMREDIYPLLAEKLDIEALKTERSHIWRTTLNSLLEGVLSQERRALLFGHTAEVNAQYYQDPHDISQLTKATA